MTTQQLVDRGLELRGEIKAREKELKVIDAKLKTLGLKRPQEELKDGDREGRRWLAPGSKLIVPVIFTADKLIQSFQKESDVMRRISAVFPFDKRLETFYAPSETYEIVFKDGKQFRAKATEILGKDAPGFVTACVARDKFGIPKSDAKVLWDDAEPV